ncbi:MAG: hypothetical protein ABJB05_01980 [Parafilimonas sp.]
MKKILFSAAIVMSTIGICVANFNSSTATTPVKHSSYIVKDTVPSDTTKPMDSTLRMKL